MKPECERFVALLEERQPSSSEQARFMEAHRAECAPCARLEEGLKAIFLPVGGAPHFPLDERSEKALLDAVLTAADEEESRGAGRRFRWGALAAGVLALLASGLWALRRPTVPSTEMAQAPVVAPAVAQPEVAPEPEPTPSEGKPLWAELRLKAGRGGERLGGRVAEGAAVIAQAGLGYSLGPDVWLRLERDSQARFETLREKKVVLALASGRVDVSVTPNEGIWLEVRMPNATVQVVGTVFSVESRGDVGRVVVERGKVRVLSGEGALEVATGQALGLGRAPPGPATREELVRLSETARQHRLCATGEGVLALSGTAGVRVDGLTLGAGPMELLVPAGRHQVARLDARGRGRERPVKVAEPGEQPAWKPPGPAAAPAPGGGPGLGLPSVGASIAELLQRAQKARAEKNWPAAVHHYQRLIDEYPGTAAAAAARLSLGQLEVDHLGEPAEGLSLCDAYARQQPEGALRAEAELCRIRALQALGRAGEERKAIDLFLQRWPDDFNAPQLERRRQLLPP